MADEQKECVRADLLRTEDEKEYSLAELSEEKFKEVISGFFNVTDMADVPVDLIGSLHRLK